MRTFSLGRYSMFAFVLATVIILALGAPSASSAQVSIGVTVGFAPPDLPVYEQPICPGDGYIWTPGYWAWDDDIGDYYWVPGTWIQAPEVGLFWTPGYWGWGGSGFVFYEGYWGPVVGFYGGINYGFGYFGHGYEGGRWQDGHFFYNQEVNNVNVTVIHNVYRTTINERSVTRVSYNGGQGGIDARATAEEERAAHDRHVGPVPDQRQNLQAARSNPEFRSSSNHGKPSVAATSRPGEFSGSGVVQAREGGTIHGGPRNAGGGGGGNNPGRGNAVHPNDIPRPDRPAPLNSGDAKADQKYQKQQNKLYAQQDKENQKLQQQQEKEHQQFSKQGGNDAGHQQMEQRHQQQTQQLEQRHTQQRQDLESRRPSGPPKR